jgi:hypothetical protein
MQNDNVGNTTTTTHRHNLIDHVSTTIDALAVGKDEFDFLCELQQAR